MLSRPLLINDKYSAVKYPSVNLEYDPAYPDLPCPHKHMELQQRLCQSVIGDFDGSKPLIAVDDAFVVIRAVNSWLDTLPPIYRLPDADTRYDKTHKYLVLQRLQIVCMGYSSIVSVLKTFVTQTHKPEPKLDHNMLRDLQLIAVDKCMQLMEIAQQLADLYIPDYNKYFLIVFTPFDTSALLCSAIIHDSQYILPKRNEILQTIAKGLELIRRLAHVTKTGSVAERVIVNLISKFTHTPEETSVFHSSPSGDSSAPKRHASSVASSDNSGTPPVPELSPDAGPTTTLLSSEFVPSAQQHSGETPLPNPIISTTAADAHQLNDSRTAIDSGGLTMDQMADYDFGPLEPEYDLTDVI